MSAHQHPQRSAYTLIELLVVIAILLVIMSLMVGAIFKTREVIVHGNTTRTMQKVESAFSKRIAELNKEARGKDEVDYIEYFNAAAGYIPTPPPPGPYTLSGGDQDRERRRGKVIFFKYLMKWSFPMTYDEVYRNIRISVNPLGAQIFGHPNAVAIYMRLREQINKDPTVGVNYNTFTGQLIANNVNDKGEYSFTESAAIMAVIYSMLAKTEDLTSAELRDTDGDGVQELYDAWGTPMRLYRWPTGDLRVEQAFANKAGTDADDPEGYLAHRPISLNTSWLYQSRDAVQLTLLATQFEALFHELNHRNRVVTSHPLYHEPIYAPMVIVSAGPRKRFGLGYSAGLTRVPDRSMRLFNTGSTAEITADNQWVTADTNTGAVPDRADDELDNIYSYRLRLAVTGQ